MPLTTSNPALGARPVERRKPVRGSIVWWLRFLGILAFISILWLRVPGAQEIQPARFDLRWLGLAMLLTIIQLPLEALVWQWLLAVQRIPHPYPKTLVAYLAGQYLGLVTPGHVGEFLAAGYISSDTGITMGYALSSVVMKKLLAWTTIFGFGIWGLPLLAGVPFLQGVQRVALIGAGIALALAAGIGLWVVSLRRLTKRWRRFSPWQVDMTELWSGMRALASAQLVIPLLLTVGAFSLLFVQLHAVLRALGIALPFILVARIMALSRVAARIVPISVVGFGSKDAAVILMLAQQGISVPAGITVTLLFLLCSYLVTLLLSGLCWWVKPLVLRRAAPTTS